MRATSFEPAPSKSSPALWFWSWHDVPRNASGLFEAEVRAFR
jgi:hypothetical protein